MNINDVWSNLEKSRNCLTCEYNSEWVEEPEDATSEEECIPHSYCGFLKCVVDDRDSCEHYKKWDE